LTGIATSGLASASVQLNNVQVFVQTSEPLADYQYVVTAYNTTGSLVAYSQSDYGAAGLELPTGGYLITASAYQDQVYSPCGVCVGVPLDSAVVSLPYQPAPAQGEYGYSFLQVTGPTTITIDTLNATATSSTEVSVTAEFVNGTYVQGASVSASVVGGQIPFSLGLTMSNTTGHDGTATLTVPRAPVEINVYDTVPINLQQSETTITTTVGGQKINVTVTWSPAYVELSGSALIIPPESNANVTLRYQQSGCCFYPIAQNGSGSAGSGSVEPPTSSSKNSTLPELAQKISPFSLESQANADPPTTPASDWVRAGVVLVATFVAVLSLLTIRSHRSRKVQTIDRPTSDPTS